MKKLFALLFVCAGLTAMAINPVHHVNTSKMQQRQLERGAKLFKTNTLAKDLTNKMVKASEAKTLNEFVKTHDLSQNTLMNRAPRRASTYTDIEGNWIYSSIENVITNGETTPTWYGIAGLNFKIDTIFEEKGYCEVYLGIMPFLTDPDGPNGTAQEPGHYLDFPDCYAWYEPATDSIGIFGGWMYKYPLTAQRSGNNTYTINARYWYTGIGDENGELAGNVSHGVVNWDYGMIELDKPFGPFEAEVIKSIRIYKTNYDAIANALEVGTSSSSSNLRKMAFYLNTYQDLFAQYGWTYTMTVSDSTAYRNAVYTDNMFMLPNATHTFDQAYEPNVDPHTVSVTVDDSTYNVVLKDSIIPEVQVPVFMYQNQACDTIFAWNLFGLSNYPGVEFSLDADGLVNFPWQPVYHEDMSAYNQDGITMTDAFVNFAPTYALYNEGGLNGYYMTGWSWDDTPCELNADKTEITWAATDIYNLYTTEEDDYLHLAYGFLASWLNNKLTFNAPLTLPEPVETWKLGDVNHDNNVNVADVTALIQFVLTSGEEPEVFYVEQANCDGDAAGVLNVADVTALIQLVLNQ